MSLATVEASGGFGDADRWAANLGLTYSLSGGVEALGDLDFIDTRSVEPDQLHPELFTDDDIVFLHTLGGTTFNGNGIAPAVDLRFPEAL